MSSGSPADHPARERDLPAPVEQGMRDVLAASDNLEKILHNHGFTGGARAFHAATRQLREHLECRRADCNTGGAGDADGEDREP